MPSLRFNRIWCSLGLVVLLGLPSLAAAEVTVLIDGAAYPADLRENVGLLARLHVRRASNTRHVEGELRGVEGSWIRASMIDQRWQGVVELDGKKYVIDSPNPPTDGAGLTLTAQLPATFAGDATCATDAKTASSAKSATIAELVTAQANFAQVCQTTVPAAPASGVCLLAELEIYFDRLFTQRPNHVSDAVAILNMVDGFYKNDMHIEFDAIEMTFLTTDVFSTTTDSSALLDDINAKRASLNLKNPRAIFHLATGRSFDGSTVGIASVGTLCRTSSNTGTSQFISNLGLTALVMAHELGHNFGAGHDGDDNACTAGFIMAATLSSSAKHFSSCSIDEMTIGINGVSTLSQCFEFPVDASLVARPGNPTTAGANTNFTLSYDLDEVNASVAASQLTVTGALTGAAGSFIGANVNGLPCTVPAGGATYSCSTGSAGGLVNVTARVSGSGSITVQANVAASGGGVKDVNPVNDSVSSAVVAGTPPTAPTMLTAIADAGGAAQINLAWTDNSGNETGFSVERQTGSGAFQQITVTAADVTTFTDASGLTAGVMYTYHVSAVGAGGTSAPATSATTQLKAVVAPGGGGGGGGGGSFGIEVTPLLLLALRRRQRAH